MSMAMAASTSMSGRKTEVKPQRVPVLYYLSTNGHLHHPHFMEVPLSSPNALFLTDVINRLNVLRGKGIASMYSWSCKRSYKNGFVWHDLSDNDFIYPAHGHEYVLKGSELPENPSPEKQPPPDRPRPRRRNHSTDFDKSNAAETDNNHRRSPSDEDEIQISPPPSDSSPETLGNLMKGNGEAPTAANREIKKCRRTTSVLMQLISCGSMSLKGCGAGPGLGLIKMRAPRGGSTIECGKGKEYCFSGSLVETNKEEFPALKRSSSYNGDR